MSSTLWLLLYLAPLLGLTAAVFAWFGWHWRGGGTQQRLKELEVQIDDAQHALRNAETECETARSKVITATAEANAQREQTEDELRTLREDLKSAQAETLRREDETAKARAAAQALDTEMAKLRRDLDLLRHERDHATAALTTAPVELDHRRAQPITQEAASGSTPIETEVPAKLKRKSKTAPKARPAPASLRDKITALETALAAHQAVVATLNQEHDDWQRRVTKLETKTPADPAGLGLARRSLADSEKRLITATSEIKRLQSHVRVLHRAEAKATALDKLPDDDLTQIKGIKKVISEQLQAHGIHTWRQIAEWDEDELRTFSELLAFKHRATREKWQEQARALHAAAHGPLA